MFLLLVKKSVYILLLTIPLTNAYAAKCSPYYVNTFTTCFNCVSSVCTWDKEMNTCCGAPTHPCDENASKSRLVTNGYQCPGGVGALMVILTIIGGLCCFVAPVIWWCRRDQRQRRIQFEAAPQIQPQMNVLMPIAGQQPISANIQRAQRGGNADQLMRLNNGDVVDSDGKIYKSVSSANNGQSIDPQNDRLMKLTNGDIVDSNGNIYRN